MPYTIFRGLKPRDNDTSTKMADVESFFIYLDFDITNNLGTVTVKGGYWAVCCSGSTDDYPQGRPVANVPPQSYYLKAPHSNGLQFHRSRLLGSRKVEYGNEFTDLHLFEFVGAPKQLVAPPPGAPAGGAAPPVPQPWVDLADWQLKHTEPKAARNQKPLLLRRLSLTGQLENRYVHALSVNEDGQGTSSVAAAMPFDNPTCLASLISLHGGPMAELGVWTGGRATPTDEVTERNPGWHYFTTDQLAANANLPGTPVGFVMVAQGAFKAITWEAIDEWQPGEIAGGRLMRQLRKLVAGYRLVPPDGDQQSRSGYLRTIESVDDTKGDGIIPRSPDDPVEVLYLDGLNDNATTPVPPIL